MTVVLRRGGAGVPRGCYSKRAVAPQEGAVVSLARAGLGHWRVDNRDLLAAVLEIERHVDSDGWDQPTLLFALVATEQIRVEQPELAPGSASSTPGRR